MVGVFWNPFLVLLLQKVRIIFSYPDNILFCHMPWGFLTFGLTPFDRGCRVKPYKLRRLPM
jgi:hypothetical protein